jgi:hypothetical protein
VIQIISGVEITLNEVIFKNNFAGDAGSELFVTNTETITINNSKISDSSSTSLWIQSID